MNKFHFTFSLLCHTTAIVPLYGNVRYFRFSPVPPSARFLFRLSDPLRRLTVHSFSSSAFSRHFAMTSLAVVTFFFTFYQVLVFLRLFESCFRYHGVLFGTTTGCVRLFKMWAEFEFKKVKLQYGNYNTGQPQISIFVCKILKLECH